jgi:hypothetical protein
VFALLVVALLVACGDDKNIFQQGGAATKTPTASATFDVAATRAAATQTAEAATAAAEAINILATSVAAASQQLPATSTPTRTPTPTPAPASEITVNDETGEVYNCQFNVAQPDTEGVKNTADGSALYLVTANNTLKAQVTVNEAVDLRQAVPALGLLYQFGVAVDDPNRDHLAAPGSGVRVPDNLMLVNFVQQDDGLVFTLAQPAE